VVYTNWYCELIRDRGSTGFLYLSEKDEAIVSSSQINFKAQTFTDTKEIEALCTILGPHGILFLIEKLMEQTLNHLEEIKVKIVCLFIRQFMDITKTSWFRSRKLGMWKLKMKRFSKN
jgi:hypothetical protein